MLDEQTNPLLLEQVQLRRNRRERLARLDRGGRRGAESFYLSGNLSVLDT
jgi:hypothetical protein